MYVMSILILQLNRFDFSISLHFLDQDSVIAHNHKYNKHVYYVLVIYNKKNYNQYSNTNDNKEYNSYQIIIKHNKKDDV